MSETERIDEHGCVIVGNQAGPHVPFTGEVGDVLVGDEARELLRRMKRGELPGVPVSVVVSYDSDDPKNRETYVWVDAR